MPDTIRGALSRAAAAAQVHDACTSSGNIDYAGTCELAPAYAEQGRYAEALQHFQHVLRRQHEQVGPDQPDTVDTTWGIANVQSAMGQYDQALKHHQKVLAINETALGRDHLVTAQPQLLACMHPCMQYCNGARAARSF